MSNYFFQCTSTINRHSYFFSYLALTVNGHSVNMFCFFQISGLRVKTQTFICICLGLLVLFYFSIGRTLMSRAQLWSYPKDELYLNDIGVPENNITTAVDFNLSDFYKTDLVSQNYLSSNLSRLLRTESEVILEAQRIHLNIFGKLIGKYKYAMLFNIAGFENKGDPAIGIGEIFLLRRLNIELVLHLEDIHNSDKAIDYAREMSKKYSNETLVILLHGGGNLLSYAHQDVNRGRIIRRFMDFEIVMFPQSFWIFTKPEHQEHFKSVYAAHPRLTFCYRDQFSFDQGSKLFPKARPLLVPDMAFQIGKVDRFMRPIHNIMWLKRGDEESPHYKIPDDAAKHDAIVADWTQGWLTPKDKRTLENGFLITANGMMFLQRGRVVITDRLHGHILSILCGIPQVVLNPVNDKIAHYRDTWTRGLENVEVATTPQEALDKAVSLLKRVNDKVPKIVTYRESFEARPDTIK